MGWGRCCRLTRSGGKAVRWLGRVRGDGVSLMTWRAGEEGCIWKVLVADEVRSLREGLLRLVQ